MGADPLEPLGQLVERARAAAAAADRSDLVERLCQTSRRLTHQGIRALVVGEFKQGKSLLVNAMVNAPICAVDDDIATSVPTMVRHGEPSKATLVYAPPEVALEAVHRGRSERSGSTEDPDAAGQEIELIREPIEVLKVAQVVGEAANPGNQRRLAYAEVELPRTLLTGGLVLVDTPGVGGIGSGHHGATMAILPTADLVLLVTDASQELIGAGGRLPAPGTEPVPERRLRADQDRPLRALAGDPRPRPASPRGAGWLADSDLPGLVDAAPARDAAREPRTQRGLRLPGPLAYLRNEVVDKRDQLTRRSVANDVHYALDNLAVDRAGGADGAAGPGKPAQDRHAGLENARQKADALGKRHGALAAGPQRRRHRSAVRHRLRLPRPDSIDRPGGGEDHRSVRPRRRSGSSSPNGSSRRSRRRSATTSSGRTSDLAGWRARSASSSPRRAVTPCPRCPSPTPWASSIPSPS